MRRRVLGHASRVLDRQSSTSIATVKSLYLSSSAFAPTSPLAKNDPLSELYPPYVFVPNELRHPVFNSSQIFFLLLCRNDKTST